MGGVVTSVVEKAVEWAYRHLGALQVCWICIAITLALGWFMTSHYAAAGEVASLRGEITELKADSIAKRIFDYRVRQCLVPIEQRADKRYLAEQIRDDAAKYLRLTGIVFVVPACEDL